MRDIFCPECGEPAQAKPPTSGFPFAAHNMTLPQHSHLDGEPLCPIMGNRGYEPAQPVDSEGHTVRAVCVGFTATRRGLTEPQADLLRRTLAHLCERYTSLVFRHGDCVEGDEVGAQIAHSLGMWVIAHPPINEVLRAYAYQDQTEPPRNYLDRNWDIVQASHVVIGCPDSKVERARSGTWATIRMARKRVVPLLVIDPHGTVVEMRDLDGFGLPC